MQLEILSTCALNNLNNPFLLKFRPKKTFIDPDKCLLSVFLIIKRKIYIIYYSMFTLRESNPKAYSIFVPHNHPKT